MSLQASLQASSPILTAIYIYPVKSCRGIRVPAAQLSTGGLEYDRNWMVVTPSGKFLTQRELPQLALIETAIDQTHLHLQAPDQPSLAIPLALPLDAATAAPLPVEVWRDRCEAVDQGKAAADWLSRFLGRDARLVRMGETYSRPVRQAEGKPPAQVSFADGFPLLLISEASLADLNQRLPAPIPMDRFRPNLVVDGCAAYAEDTWQHIRIQQTRFDVVKPCERCVITTTDQATALRDAAKQPLTTLATYRRVPGGVIFGQNLIHRSTGAIQTGSPVEVLP